MSALAWCRTTPATSRAVLCRLGPLRLWRGRREVAHLCTHLLSNVGNVQMDPIEQIRIGLHDLCERAVFSAIRVLMSSVFFSVCRAISNEIASARFAAISNAAA